MVARRFNAGGLCRDGRLCCLGILHLADRRVQLIRNALVRPFYGFELPVWTPDSRRVVAKLWPVSETVRYDGHDTDTELSSPNIVVFSHDPDVRTDNRANARHATDRLRCDFGAVDVSTSDVHRLAEDWHIMGGWRISPDGTAVAVPVIVEADAANQQFISDLMVVPLDGPEPRCVARGVIFDYGQSFSWSPDGTQIAFTTSDQPFAEGERPPGRLLVTDADGRRQPRDLSTDIGDDLRQAYEHPRWSATGDQVFCLVADGVWCVRADGSAARKIPIASGTVLTSWIQPPNDQVMHWATDGTLPLLLRSATSQALELALVDGTSDSSTPNSMLRERYVTGEATLAIEVDWSQQVAYLPLEAADHPPEMWRLDLTTADASRLASLNPSLQDHQFGSKRLVEFLDADGVRRHASLLLPNDYVSDEQVPMIVIVYGGSWLTAPPQVWNARLPSFE